RAQLRRAREDVRDVAGFVARRDDNRDARARPYRRRAERARYQQVRQRQQVERPELDEVTIRQSGERRERQRQQHLRTVTYDLEVREGEQALHVFDREPGLRKVGARKTQAAGESERQLPEASVGVYGGARRR